MQKLLPLPHLTTEEQQLLFNIYHCNRTAIKALSPDLILANGLDLTPSYAIGLASGLLSVTKGIIASGEASILDVCSGTGALGVAIAVIVAKNQNVKRINLLFVESSDLILPFLRLSVKTIEEEFWRIRKDIVINTCTYDMDIAKFASCSKYDIVATAPPAARSREILGQCANLTLAPSPMEKDNMHCGQLIAILPRPFDLSFSGPWTMTHAGMLDWPIVQDHSVIGRKSACLLRLKRLAVKPTPSERNKTHTVMFNNVDVWKTTQENAANILSKAKNEIY